MPSLLPKSYQKIKTKIQIMQNKCTGFCLRLHKLYHIFLPEFRSKNWLPTKKRVHQCINVTTFKFVNNSHKQKTLSKPVNRYFCHHDYLWLLLHYTFLSLLLLLPDIFVTMIIYGFCYITPSYPYYYYYYPFFKQILIHLQFLIERSQ